MNTAAALEVMVGKGIEKVLFDRRDHELLSIVNDVLNRDRSRSQFKRLLNPYLHPHGIKEMGASPGLRIAYAIINLLDSLEASKGEDRIQALQSLRNEVFNITYSIFRKNTARVLVEIMKELVRSHGDYRRQLELAHDFRSATSGKHLVIRKFLRRYHLVEMPEAWNQVAFDDHVHDAQTKGRKSASHLVMDAWIKGIRHLTVIYYNHVRPEAVMELLEAAEIMGITARIGIELSARFHSSFAQLIWLPPGFPDAQDFIRFLEEPSVLDFMAQCRKVSAYQQRYVMAVLEAFNKSHRPALNRAYDIQLAPLKEADFLAFVGTGQASLLHLSRFIHKRLLPVLRDRVELLRTRYETADPEKRLEINSLLSELDKLGSETILDRYLRPERNPSLPDPAIPRDGSDVPEMLKLSPSELSERLNQLHSGYRITLNLSNLKVEDVLELLYDCEGRITHLEIFNLKDYFTGKAVNSAEINGLQLAINEGNVITLKRLIRGIIQRMETSEQPGRETRLAKMREILRNISTLQSYYKSTPLKSRIGSDSTGRSRVLHGMGLVVKDTLPYRAQRQIDRSLGPSLQIIPFYIKSYLRETYIPPSTANVLIGFFLRLLRLLPGMRWVGYERRPDWMLTRYSYYVEGGGNVATLGGIHAGAINGFSLAPPAAPASERKLSWRYLNTGLKNMLKAVLGFIPAFMTFALTKDWWVLAYFGAFIWFGITGFRNILQSVLGGGGIRRSPLLRWNDYVSWDRITDSLLFTGFSVPLLDYLVKTLLLNDLFNITTATNPKALYMVMAIVNGIYISTHNVLRGLPRGAVLGNFFRTILSIPLAVAMNAAAGGMLASLGVVDYNAVLQKWAAIISKTASDCVAGVIEGLADRQVNIRARRKDYDRKFQQLFDAYARLELLFPESDVLKMLKSPKEFIRTIGIEAADLEKIVIINALDLFYFWMYQPRARSVMRAMLRSMSCDERQIIARSQFILQRRREISQLFLDGLLGKRFSKALSFYLGRSEGYMETLKKIA